MTIVLSFGINPVSKTTSPPLSEVLVGCHSRKTKKEPHSSAKSLPKNRTRRCTSVVIIAFVRSHTPRSFNSSVSTLKETSHEMDEEGGIFRTGKERKGLTSSTALSREEMASLAPSSKGRSASALTQETEGEAFLSQQHRPEDGFSDDEGGGSGSDRLERSGFLGTQEIPRKRQHRSLRGSLRARNVARLERLGWDDLLVKTLLPDTGLSIRGHAILEASGFATKLLKFVVWTFVSIALVHVIVAHLFDDRDRVLRIAHIWRYESDLIVRDCLVFFIVGRLWEKRGIDHMAWMGTALLANLYFESQNFVGFLQHSVTLFQMHCIWPWELWVFALVLVIAAGGLVAAHVLKAWRDRLVVAKLVELGLCVLFFMAPMITSDYFHMHHWYAGWLMGMQFNYDVW
jgi:hypothetical protein